MTRNQLRFGLFDDGRPDPPPDAPQVYLASPLTSLDGEPRNTVLAWCHIVENTIDEVTRQAEDPWLVRVHVPARLSAPWNKDGRSEDAIFEGNALTLWTDTDALILIGHRGGSTGAGQELEWACGRGLPILYVAAKDDAVSRQVKGTPADLTVHQFDGPDELHDAVSVFLRKHRRVIEDGPRRRASARVRFAPTLAKLRDAWRGLPGERALEVAARARLSVTRIELCLKDPIALVAMPSERLLDLSAALGVDALFEPEPLPELQFDELRAMLTAQTEYDWDDALVAELSTAARLELARGGTRRFRLTTIEDWLRFREQWRR